MRVLEQPANSVGTTSTLGNTTAVAWKMFAAVDSVCGETKRVFIRVQVKKLDLADGTGPDPAGMRTVAKHARSLVQAAMRCVNLPACADGLPSK